MVTWPTPRWPIPIQHSFTNLWPTFRWAWFLWPYEIAPAFTSPTLAAWLCISKELRQVAFFFITFSGTAVRFADETDTNVLRHGYFVSAFSSSAQNLGRNYSTSKDALYKVSYHFNLTSSDFLFGLDVWVMFANIIVEMRYLVHVPDVFSLNFKHLFFFLPWFFFLHPFFWRFPWCDFWGRVIFLCTVVISCLLAHVLEQTSRARFKAKQRVEETQVRGGQTPRGLGARRAREEIAGNSWGSNSWKLERLAWYAGGGWF